MRRLGLALVALLGAVTIVRAADMHSTQTPALDSAAATRFANLALACLHREYPNKIAHVMASDADALPPHVLTPAFYGCVDWHSAVHGHWLLVRLLRLFPSSSFAGEAKAALAISLTPANISGEVAYVGREDRTSFERPYGLSWLLQLCAELRTWDDPQARQWAATLAPLETVAASKIKSWLPKLHYPIRIGEHDQTAFSFGLIWDWAGVAGDTPMRALLADAAERFYRGDRNCPLSYELAQDVPAPNSLQRPNGMVEARSCDGPRRSKACAYRRSQLEPGVDARGNSAWPASRRSSATRTIRRSAGSSRSRTSRGDRRALRGGSLAGHLRGLSNQSGWVTIASSHKGGHRHERRGQQEGGCGLRCGSQPL
jgi:hypothetical protein